MKRSKLRKVILKIHLYGGVLATGYLFVFLISAIHLNHDPEFLASNEELTEWEATVDPIKQKTKKGKSDAIMQQLDIVGNNSKWSRRIDENGNLNFDVYQPAKHHNITYFENENRVEVRTVEKGFWNSVHGLHFMTSSANGASFNLWPWYSYICSIYLIFSILSGVYLWADSKRDKFISWSVLSFLGGGSLILILYIYLA